jgi:hypothetical protein
MEKAMEKAMEKKYYAYVRSGSDPMPARGPFRSFEEADAAMERFKERYGHLASHYLASGNVRLVGPYATRAAALDADISTAIPVRR